MSLEHAISEAVKIALERHLPPLIQKYQPVPEPIEDERKTTEEAARILGISPITMAIWRTKGKGPDFDFANPEMLQKMHRRRLRRIF